jgi:hypothetical protein
VAFFKLVFHFSRKLIAFYLVVNTTISINVVQSWTNSSVALRTIEKSALIFNGQAIWNDISSNSFYIWGGAAWYRKNFPQIRSGGSTQTEMEGAHGALKSLETLGSSTACSALLKEPMLTAKILAFWWADGPAAGLMPHYPLPLPFRFPILCHSIWPQNSGVMTQT